MKRFKKLSTVLAFVLLFTTLFSTMAFGAVPAPSDRLGGRTRIETAVEISQKWETSSAVVLATGNDYPDALVAGPLAGALDAPVLLAYKDVLPEATKDRIAELKASTVYIVGGAGVISEKVEAELRKVVATVDRVWGANRYETAVAVAKKVALLKEVDKAYVVNGYDFAGALAVGPLAAKEGAVLLYADGNSFDNVAVDALAAIGNPDVTVVGDKISADVYAAVGASERIAGADVYALGLAVAGKFDKVDGVAVAVGDMYPDALAGAALKVPMLFIKTGAASLGDANAAFLAANKASIAKAYVLGGEGVVVKAVKDAFDAAVVDVPLAVVGVSATNLKEVTVKFNKAIDSSTAKAANFVLSPSDAFETNANVSSVELSADGKTATLTLENNFAANQKAFKVAIENVKDLAGNVLPKTEVAGLAFDVTIPKALSAKLTGPKTVEVTFSEPINVAGAYILNNGAIYIYNEDADNTNKVTVNLGSTLAEGVYTLKVSGAKDLAGFVAPDAELTFAYGADTVAPVVSIDTVSQNSVKFVFSKAIEVGGRANAEVYHTYNGNVTYKGVLTWADDGKSVTAAFAGNYLPIGNVNVFFKAGDGTDMVDAWGNALQSQTFSVAISADTTPPTVSKVEVVSSTSIEVTFSEVVGDGANVPANYVLKDASGKAVAVTGAALDGKVVTLTTATINGAIYTLTIKDVKDASISKNKMAEFNIVLNVKDTIAPGVSSVVISSDGKKIKVYFSEAMSTEGLTDLSKYYYITDTAIEPFPSGTSIVALNNQTVQINLKDAIADLDGTGDKIVVTGDLKDLAGNKIGGLYVSEDVASDAIGVVADSAKAKSLTTIEFKVDRELGSIDVTKFTVNGVAKSVVFATYVNGAGESTVTLLIDKAKVDIKSDLSNLTNVVCAADAFTNTFGTKSGEITIEKANVADNIAPSIVSVKTALNGDPAVNVIVVEYSENIDPASVSKYTYAVDGSDVKSVSVAGKNVTIFLVEALGNDATPKVTQAGQVEDLAGNVLGAQKAITAEDGI